jgi:hypothetical protein
MEGLGSEKAQDPLVPRYTCALQGRFASREFLILTISHSIQNLNLTRMPAGMFSRFSDPEGGRLG